MLQYQLKRGFNGHPPLGVNATVCSVERGLMRTRAFQWAPTLGGECYSFFKLGTAPSAKSKFQWAPTLGGECYIEFLRELLPIGVHRFNGHPPLGVNATDLERMMSIPVGTFQWAPTLGGECYWLLIL